MPHIKPKADQRVIVRELRGCMESDGIRIGDVGTVKRLPNGDQGVQFDRLESVFVRYAPGIDSMVVNCCDALEKTQECPESRDSGVSVVNPWDVFWKAAESRKKAFKRANDRKYKLTDQGVQICLLLDYFSAKEKVQ